MNAIVHFPGIEQRRVELTAGALIRMEEAAHRILQLSDAINEIHDRQAAQHCAVVAEAQLQRQVRDLEEAILAAGGKLPGERPIPMQSTRSPLGSMADAVPFASAFEAVAWAIKVTKQRSLCLGFTDRTKRACDAGDVLTVIERCDLRPGERRALITWGERGVMPDHCPELLTSALATLTIKLRLKGIVA